MHDRLTYDVEHAAVPARQLDGWDELAPASMAGDLDRVGSHVTPGVQL